MGKENIILRFEQNGRSISVGTGFEDYKIISIEGLTGLEFDFMAAYNPQLPGATIKRTKPLMRQIDVVMDCASALREHVLGFFNPYDEGKLTVTRDGVTKWIRYKCHPVRVVQENIYHDLTLQIRLICEQPYFLDMSDYGKNIAQKRARLAFPFVMLKRGMITDYRILSAEVGIMNNGDVPVPVEVIFRATGPVKGPKLTINKGKFLRADVAMVGGDEIRFNTNSKGLISALNGVDILNETDPHMSFFQIPRGQSSIEYSADEGTSNLSVHVFYRPQYLGA